MLAQHPDKVFNEWNMRENETDPHEFDYAGAFGQLTEQIRGSRDAGLNSFEANLREAQEYLRREYLTPNTPLDGDEINDIEADFEREWSQAGAIARISGRVYLTNEAEEDFVPKEWGEGIADENGDLYYIVDGASVRSLGAEIAISYTENGEVSDVYAAYTFAFVDDEDETFALSARIDDLYEHAYEQPTPHEAIVRLEKDWPQEFEFIKEWTQPDGKAPLPARLEYLTRELQAELRSSETFRRLVEVYLQFCIAFDETLPYSVSLTHAFEYFEGGNPYLEDKKGEWVKFDLAGHLTVLGFRPKITFEKDTQNTIQSKLLFSTYNVEDGDEAEYIRLDASNITSFISTRALRSLVSKAMFNDAKEVAQEVFADSINELDVIDSRDDTTIDYAEQDAVEPSMVPERIERLTRIERAINDAIRLVKSRQAIVYDTPEEALEATKKLWLKELQPLIENLNLADIYTFFHVSGEGVQVPAGEETFTVGDADDDNRIRVAYEVSQNKFVAPMQPGDSYTGQILSLVPAIGGLGVEGVEDEEGDENEIQGYRVKPAILVGAGRKTYVPIDVVNIPMVEVSIDKRILVPLDGSADIKLEALEHYRELEEIIATLDTPFERSSIIELVQTLNRGLLDYIRTDSYVKYDAEDLFTEAADEMLFLEDDAQTFKKVVKMFEKVLVGQRVSLKGEIFVLDEENKFTPLQGAQGNETVEGVVLDVRTDIDGNELFLAIAGAGSPAVFVRLRSIEEFRF